MLRQGIGVAVEIVAESCDAGLIPEGVEVVAAAVQAEVPTQSLSSRPTPRTDSSMCESDRLLPSRCRVDKLSMQTLGLLLWT